jgi:diaminohydroxyphosphoribosylaminopyrimidine deaminase/5-amino-6-(5-phosphoribosylamino)uracil reductase
MRRAIELAARGLGITRPNPVVGCVILDSTGGLVGEGWHERAGGPHAEVAALAHAGRRAHAGTAVVTLEPCRHTGRTGPCTEALVAAGIARVVFAVPDPSPRAGGGAAILAAAGVAVEQGMLRDQAEQGNEVWLTSMRLGRPHVTWKTASSLDGQVAAADGSSRWITGPQARHEVHLLRARSDAVLVGVGTVLADDPELTARDVGAKRQPLRVVLDRSGRTPADARVRNDAAETHISGEAPPQVLADLHARGVQSVLLEGGPTVAGSFLREGMVDRVLAYVAPVLLGSGQWPVLVGTGQRSIDEAVRLRLDDVTRVGDDVRISARLAPAGQAGEGSG